MSWWTDNRGRAVGTGAGYLLGGGLGAIGGYLIGNNTDEAHRRSEHPDPDFEPVYSDYTQVFDPNTMSITPEIQARLNEMYGSDGSLGRFKEEALRRGPSAWAGLTQQQINLENMQRRNEAQREMSGQQATARTQLAMRGGIDSGARERLAQSGARNMMNINQDIGMQGQRNRLSVLADDEKNRIGQLGALNGMEMSALNAYGTARSMDIGNRMKEAQSRNQFAVDRASLETQARASNRQARAIERSGKK